MSQSLRFRFDRQLWRRFVSVFQLYLYPESATAGRQILILLLLSFSAVLGASVLLFLSVKLIVQFFSVSFYATYIANVLRGFFVFDFKPSAVKLSLLFGFLLFVFYYFWVQRQRLDGRLGRWIAVIAILFFLLCVTEANIILVNTFRLITNSLVNFQSQSYSKVDGIEVFTAHIASQSSFWKSLGVYGWLLAIVMPVLIGYFFLRLKFVRYWRGWLTRHFMSHYYDKRCYYQLNSNDPAAVERGIDNPDQRISEDLRNYTESTLAFILDLSSAILDLIGFSGLLWIHSKNLAIILCFYAVIATVLAALISQRLIKIEYNQLKFEANFRFGLIHTRNNAESIAFFRGESQEEIKNDTLLEKALKNFDKKIIWMSIISFYQRSYAFVSRILPYFFIVPEFFSGKIRTFGDIELILFSFSMVQSALSTITFGIDNIARSAASINRLGLFYEALKGESSTKQDTQVPSSIVLDSQSPGFNFDQVTYYTPDGERLLLEGLNYDLGNKRLMVVGPSGCGKSSLLRVLAGLWNCGSGKVSVPGDDLFFVPQRPYMFLGTLREQLLFPFPDQDIPDDRLIEALHRFNLEGCLQGYESDEAALNVIHDWSKLLSLGEQQRVTFVRIYLHQPKVLLLDEATSALDKASEEDCFHFLKDSSMQYISVSHNLNLAHYFDEVMMFKEGSKFDILNVDQFLSL